MRRLLISSVALALSSFVASAHVAVVPACLLEVTRGVLRPWPSSALVASAHVCSFSRVSLRLQVASTFDPHPCDFQLCEYCHVYGHRLLLWAVAFQLRSFHLCVVLCVDNPFCAFFAYIMYWWGVFVFARVRVFAH